MENGSGSGADFPYRRDEKVSLPAAGRLCDRKRVDEIPARELRLYLIPGGLPDGLPFLRLHHRRAYQKSGAGGDAGTDLRDPAADRGTDFQCGGHGDGEPLDNYENLVRFIRLVSDEKGFGLSQRSVTVSTCGIVPGIYQLAQEHFSITLAISLHAPNDESRKRLMPVANRYTIGEIMEACRVYFKETGRRISFEYSLVAGENDGMSDAKELAELLKGHNCHVNLIPVNPVRERSFVQSDKKLWRNSKISLKNTE